MKTTKAFVYIIVAGVLWGTSGVFVHYLAPYGFSALQMTAVRGTVSFLCMLAFVLLRAREALRVRPWELFLLAGCGVSLVGSAAFYYASMQLTSVSTAVVLMYTAPVYVMLVSVSLFKERLTGLKLFSVGCMLLGCVLVSGIIGGLRVDAVGILLGVLSGISYASYNLLTKFAMRRGCNTLSVTLYSFFFMALVAWAICSPWQMGACVALDPLPVLTLCLLLGLVTHVSPYIFYTLALRTLPAGTASALSIVEPMAATVISCIFLGERLQWIAILGILFILTATLLLSRTETKKSTEENEI